MDSHNQLDELLRQYHAEQNLEGDSGSEFFERLLVAINRAHRTDIRRVLFEGLVSKGDTRLNASQRKFVDAEIQTFNYRPNEALVDSIGQERPLPKPGIFSAEDLWHFYKLSQKPIFHESELIYTRADGTRVSIVIDLRSENDYDFILTIGDMTFHSENAPEHIDSITFGESLICKTLFVDEEVATTLLKNSLCLSLPTSIAYPDANHYFSHYNGSLYLFELRSGSGDCIDIRTVGALSGDYGDRYFQGSTPKDFMPNGFSEHLIKSCQLIDDEMGFGIRAEIDDIEYQLRYNPAEKRTTLILCYKDKKDVRFELSSNDPDSFDQDTEVLRGHLDLLEEMPTSNFPVEKVDIVRRIHHLYLAFGLGRDPYASIDIFDQECE